MKKYAIVLVMALIFAIGQSFAQVFKTSTGEVSFISKTDFESFEAVNNQVTAAYSRKKLQFRVPINAFIFEKKLMQTHFQENYMESSKFPNASFKGSIISPEDFKISSKEQPVTVKGTLNIHGVDKESEIVGTIQNTPDGVVLKANFTIILSDYQIGVPSNLTAKISQNIDIKVNALLLSK